MLRSSHGGQLPRKDIERAAQVDATCRHQKLLSRAQWQLKRQQRARRDLASGGVVVCLAPPSFCVGRLTITPK